MTRRISVPLLAGAALVLYHHDPAGSSLFLPCPLHALTGLDCPLCGTTRAMHHLTHGRAEEAFGLNPLVVVALPFVAWFVLRRRAPRLPSWAVAAAGVAFGVLRNLPFAAFAWMGT